MFRHAQKLWTNGFDDPRFHPFDAGISFFISFCAPLKDKAKDLPFNNTSNSLPDGVA